MARISPCSWIKGPTESLLDACIMAQFDDGGVSIPSRSVGRGLFGERFRESIWVGVGVGR